MAKFDVYRVRGGDLVVDCQANLLSHFKSRFIVPLRPADEAIRGVFRLNPRFEVAGKTLILATQLARAIDVRDIEATITSLAEHDLIISNALDVLISGC